MPIRNNDNEAITIHYFERKIYYCNEYSHLQQRLQNELSLEYFHIILERFLTNCNVSIKLIP